MLIRNPQNPIITPDAVMPSRKDFKVDCAFNAASVKYKDETLLLLRVGESVISMNEKIVKVPLLQNVNGQYRIIIKEFNKNNKRFDFSDPRSIKTEHALYLTSMSHFRIARSKDGVHFKIDEKPFMAAENEYETFGIEDPRITPIEGKYYINYSVVSEKGIATALAVTNDFITVERKGIIFCPDNKDVCLIPERINGYFYAIHRPIPRLFGTPDIWIARSPDLIHWGEHKHLLSVKDHAGWANQRIGGGAPFIKTEQGWLQIYHGADQNKRYCLGAFLLDLENPEKIIARSQSPLFEPETDYELNGFFGKVVFTCGVNREKDRLKIYYGCSDESMALAEISLEKIYAHLNIQEKL